MSDPLTIYELAPQPHAGYAELRVNAHCVAKVDLLLLDTLFAARKRGALPLFLEAVSQPAPHDCQQWRDEGLGCLSCKQFVADIAARLNAGVAPPR